MVTLLDVDLTDRVVEWGQLEMIKGILLGHVEMFTSEALMIFENVDGVLSKAGPASLIKGADWYGATLVIQRNGLTVFEGVVVDVANDDELQVAEVRCENIFKRPAESTIVTSGSRVNAAQAILGILRTVLDDDLIDLASFHAAAGPSRAANAWITYSFLDGDGITVMDAIGEIARLASMAVFVQNNQMHCEAFKSYQGSGAGLHFEINDSIVRQWGKLRKDSSSFQNQVRVGYTADDYVVRTDRESVKVNDVTREISFAGDAAVVSSDYVSARYFGDTYLERAAYRRHLQDVAAGPELWGAVIGERYPVTRVEQGMARFPMEVIEVHPRLDTDEVVLTLAELQEP